MIEELTSNQTLYVNNLNEKVKLDGMNTVKKNVQT